MPLFLQTFSGNDSDKETILTIIENLKENLRFYEMVYHVADSAFCTAHNLQTMGQHMFWISRVPSTITEVRTLIHAECSFSPCSDERYGYSEYFSEYAGIRQKWVLYHSAEMHTRQEKTFEKNLEKDLRNVR